MKTLNSTFLKLYFLSFICLTAVSCQDDTPLPPMTFHGPVTQLGDGNIRSFVKIDEDGAPEEIGLTFPESALNNLPHTMTFFEIQLPQQAYKTPFDHIGFDWNPHGHEPEGVYNVPHFDMHFYMIPSAERIQIGVEDPLSEKLPPTGFMPASYIPLPGSVPQMGKHWLDPSTPELNGGEFTQVMMMGSYNEEVIFYEPMITLDYLKEKKSENIPLELPQQYHQEGKYYPTAYRISFDQKKKEYTVSLTGLTLR